MQANPFTFIQPLYFMGKIARNLERLQMPFQRKNVEIRTIPAGTYVVGYQGSEKVGIKEWGRI